MYLYCPVDICRKNHLQCLYSCDVNIKAGCSEYLKNYETFLLEEVSSYYFEKYGPPILPVPLSIARKEQAATKKERDREKKELLLEKENKRKLKAKKKLEKENLKLEKIKLRENKKTAKMIKKEVSQRGKKAKLPESIIPTVKAISEMPVEKKKRGRPKKIVQVIENSFFM